MLYMMRGIFCSNSLPCKLLGVRTAILPCLALHRAACSCSCGSLTLWRSRILSWTDLTSLGQCLMLMMMFTRTQTHLLQPWRLNRCNHSFIHWLQLFMWQPDTVGVAHFIMDCIDLLGAAPAAHGDGSPDSKLTSSALAAGIDVYIHIYYKVGKPACAARRPWSIHVPLAAAAIYCRSLNMPDDCSYDGWRPAVNS